MLKLMFNVQLKTCGNLIQIKICKIHLIVVYFNTFVLMANGSVSEICFKS
jgi:hypothetical protein